MCRYIDARTYKHQIGRSLVYIQIVFGKNAAQDVRIRNEKRDDVFLINSLRELAVLIPKYF